MLEGIVARYGSWSENICNNFRQVAHTFPHETAEGECFAILNMHNKEVEMTETLYVTQL